MNKKEFEAYFRRAVLPLVKSCEKGFPDKPMRREAWNAEVDALIEGGILPQKARNWANPM